MNIYQFYYPQISFSQDGTKLYSAGSEEGHGNYVAVLCMKTGNVLQTIKPKKEVYRFCLDVGHTKCIIGKSTIIDSLKLTEDPHS